MIRAILLAALLLAGCSHTDKSMSIEERAAAIHRRALTVDSHIDTPLHMLRKGYDMGVRHEPGGRGVAQYDLPRMAEGGLDGAFFAIFTGQRAYTPAGYRRVRERADKLLAAVYAMCERHGELCEPALRADDLARIAAKGKRAIYLGMENGYPIGRDLSKVEAYYNRGIRYITLCHTRDNDICDSSTDKEHPQDRGLSDFGRRVVAEMNRLGMIVDVSHISDKSFADVLAASKAPVIASHSCCRALRDHPRNLSDAMIKELAARDGVIQICILGDYLKKLPENKVRKAAWAAVQKKHGKWDEAKDEKTRELLRRKWWELKERHPDAMASVADVVDHIDHAVRLVGIDHVGIGTDMDGGGGVTGCNDVSGMGNITLELVRRGYDEEAITKIWGGNLLRVFRAVEATAGGR